MECPAMSYGLHKNTKYVNLVFFMKAGVRIAGQYHVPENTSASVRPSDALHEVEGFINLNEAEITSPGGKVRRVSFVSIALDAIAWVEFPPLDDSWNFQHPEAEQ
jgi:hypothetical protein